MCLFRSDVQPTQPPTLIDAIPYSLRRQYMTTPSNTNGNVDGDEDRGNWSQLGEMIGHSVNPTATATSTSVPTANTNADNATTTKSYLSDSGVVSLETISTGSCITGFTSDVNYNGFEFGSEFDC
jgi:hypothetical protein